MKEFRITTQNITPASNDDCYLAPEDPIWGLLPSHQLGGLGSEEALAKYARLQTPVIAGSDKGRIAREQNIRPGTDAWFKHWFGDKR